MKAKELSLKVTSDLLLLKRDLEKKRLGLRFGSILKGDKLKPAEYGAMRKDIARINTVLREKKQKGEV